MQKLKHVSIFSVLCMSAQLFAGFGGWSIHKELFDFILEHIPEGKTILELGSGWGTSQLTQHYTVYSIEHNPKWVGKYDSNYIYAPIKNGWYDTEVLKEQLPLEYDLILVDGPPGVIGRMGFYDNLHLFNTNVLIIFDDVHRRDERILCQKVAEKLGREQVPIPDTYFAVIYPN